MDRIVTFCRSFGQREYTVFVMSLALIFLFADQNLMAPNLTQIGDYFGFDERETDTKLGSLIAVGFFCVGGPISVIAGYYADVMNRVHLFGLVTLFGSIASGSTYFVQTYGELYFVRVMTGISIGGAIPITLSLLADLYTTDLRIKAVMIVTVASNGGIAFGQLLAGLIGPKDGWRLPFLIIAIPAIILGILVLLTVKDPARGASEQAVISYMQQKGIGIAGGGGCDEGSLHGNSVSTQSKKVSYGKDNPNEWNNGMGEPIVDQENNNDDDRKDNSNSRSHELEVYSEKIDWSKVKHLFKTRTVVLVYLQGIPGCVPWGLMFVYMNDYLSQDRGMTVQNATIAVTLFGVGSLLGVIAGGYVGQMLYNRKKVLITYLMGGTTFVGVFPMYYALNGSSNNAFFYVILFISGFIVSITGPNVRSVLQSVTAPEVRGTAFAIYNLTDDLGKGFGPVIVDAIVYISSGDKKTAYNVVISFWFICAILLLMMSKSMVPDEEAVQEEMKRALRQGEPNSEAAVSMMKEGNGAIATNAVSINRGSNPGMVSNKQGQQLVKNPLVTTDL